MPQLRTKLSVDECLHRLREQVQPQTFFSRLNIFRSARSRVTGKVGPDEFMLESSADRFSKRIVGQFRAQSDGTIIDYRWQTSLIQYVYGDSRFDEMEILSFLLECLDAEEM